MVFSRLFGKPEEPEARPYLEAMLILATADGRLDKNELVGVIALIVRHPAAAGMSEQQLSEMAGQCLQAIASEGVEARIHAVSRMLPSAEDRVLAIKMCLLIAMADGELQPPEMAVLYRMRDIFGLSQGQVDSVVNEYKKTK